MPFAKGRSSSLVASLAPSFPCVHYLKAPATQALVALLVYFLISLYLFFALTQCISLMGVKSLGTPNMIRLKMTPFTPCTRSKQFWLIYRSLFLKSNVYNYQDLRPRFLPLIKSKQCCIHVHPVHFTRPPPLPPPLPEKCLFFTTLFARSKGEGIVIRDVRGIGKVDLMLHLHI